MTRRRLTTGVTLVVLLVVLCVMAVWGYHAATSPISDSSSSSATPSCSPQDQQVAKFLQRSGVTVSVYNSGKRPGRAQETLAALERAGFKPGAVGNAPDGIQVKRASVYTTKSDDPAAELVAKAFGQATQVVHTDNDMGPGVDVVIGDKFKQLDPKAPRKIALPKPQVTCQ